MKQWVQWVREQDVFVCQVHDIKKRVAYQKT